jgi:hypothetical protein
MQRVGQAILTRIACVFAMASSSSCFDTPRQYRVTFEVSGLTGNDAIARVLLHRAGSVVLEVIPLANDADASVDAGALLREVYWDGAGDTFVFDVELPRGTYDGFRVEAHAALQCDGGMPVDVTLERGQATGITLPVSNAVVTVSLVSVTSSPVCR